MAPRKRNSKIQGMAGAVAGLSGHLSALEAENAELRAFRDAVTAALSRSGKASGKKVATAAAKPKQERRKITDPEVLARRNAALAKARAARAEKLATAKVEAERAEKRERREKRRQEQEARQGSEQQNVEQPAAEAVF